jgi:hypothetical protein
MRGLTVAVVALSLAAGVAKGEGMSKQAKGTFEVKVTPVPGEGKPTVASGRLALEKTFQGDFAGTSKGEMWTADTSVKGSAGYVAIERLTGSLGGRSGSFTVLHQATMRGGADFKMSLVIVPDSGTEGLTGIAGRMSIVIEGRKHLYELDYTLP